MASLEKIEGSSVLFILKRLDKGQTTKKRSVTIAKSHAESIQ